MEYYYNPFDNVILNDCGFIVFNIFNIITPNQLFLFKQKKECMNVSNIHGEAISLIWPVKGMTRKEYYEGGFHQ